MIRNALLTLMLLMPGASLAQTWLSNAVEDGVWFLGFAAPETREFLFQCGGRSAQNLPFENSDISEPLLTDPGFIMLSVSPDLFEDPGQEVAGLTLVVDDAPFPMPPLRFSDFDGYFEVPLAVNNPVFPALRAGQQAGVTWHGEWVAQAVSLRGSSGAIAAMTQPCVTGWASLPRTAQTWTDATVLAEAERYCGGPARLDMTFVPIQDLDGDNRPDLVLNMGEVFCPDAESWEQRGAGMCGASHCSSFVYLSRGLAAAPAEILSIGTRITMNERGQWRIHGGAGLGECSALGLTACEYQFDPTTGTLEYLGLVPYDPNQ